MLPHVLALNAPAAPAAERRIATALSATSALDGLLALRQRLGGPVALRDLGLEESQIPDAVAAILPVVPPSNPAPVTADDLDRLLRAAWAGAAPHS